MFPALLLSPCVIMVWGSSTDWCTVVMMFEFDIFTGGGRVGQKGQADDG